MYSHLLPLPLYGCSGCIHAPWCQYIKIFPGSLFWCKYMRHMYSHVGEYRKIFLANYLCIGFVPGGIADISILLKFRERPRGVENSGGWKTYRKFGEKPLPKNVFGPPTYDTFPPPLFWRLSVISLKRRGTDQTNPNF